MRTLELISIFICLIFFSQKKIFAKEHGSMIESDYTRIKECFSSGNYSEAKELIEGLEGRVMRDDEMSRYISIYQALALHKLGDSTRAIEILEVLLGGDPNWGGRGEVLYWLGVVLFEAGNRSGGLGVLLRDYGEQYGAILQDLRFYFLKEIECSSELEMLFKLSNKDSAFAEAMVQKINRQPICKRNYHLVEALATGFGLYTNDYPLLGRKKSSSKKDVYRVAVLLPFYLEAGSEGQGGECDKAFALYQGIRYAVSEMRAQGGVQVELYVYDIVPGSEILPDLIAKEEFIGMDLMIGPMSAMEVGLVSEFSKKFGIPIFNPLSDDINIIADNPFYFLYKASMDSKARVAAMYTIETLKPDSRVAILYSGGDLELQAAKVYKDYLEGNSGHRVEFLMALNNGDASGFLNFYIKKSRRGVAGANLVYAFPSLEGISHLYVISKDELVAASVLSVAEILNNNVLLIADESWLGYESITMDRFLSLNIVFLTSNFIDYGGGSIYEYRRGFFDAFSSFPNFYSITGYDLMIFLGCMLGTYGEDFISQFPKIETFGSKILNDVKYSFGHDNRIVQVARISEAGYRRCFGSE